MADSMQSKGGRARAESLSPAQRKAIASKAARKRWDGAPAEPVAEPVYRGLGVLIAFDLELPVRCQSAFRDMLSNYKTVYCEENGQGIYRRA